MIKNLTAEEFKELIFDYTNGGEWSFKSTKPAIIDFFAEWCGPCKIVAPILEELSTEYPEVDFYKVDSDTEIELASTFGIRSIPAILFIPKTGEPQMAVGALPKETFVQAIKTFLLA
jgi:thioredoxin 1